MAETKTQSTGRSNRRTPPRDKARRVNFLISAELSNMLIDNPDINISDVCRRALEHAVTGVDRDINHELQGCIIVKDLLLGGMTHIARFAAESAGLVVMKPEPDEKLPK